VSLTDQRTALAGAPLLPFQPPMLMSIYSAVAAGFLDRVHDDLTSLLARAPRHPLPIAAASCRP
jgi:NAD(P)H dehydrogenase (quinone)